MWGQSPHGGDMAIWPPEANFDPANFQPMSPVCPVGVDDTPTTQALSYCQPLDGKMQSLGSRVQKLERSRGQINKDIADMLKEAQEWRREAEGKRPTTASATSANATASSVVPDAAAPLKMPPLQRGITAPVVGSVMPSASKIARAPGGSMTPPPGLNLGSSSATPELPQLSQQNVEVDGKMVHTVKWRIDRVETKFRDCVGRPLVSQPFEVKDKVNLPELRLMVLPNLGQDISSLTMKEQKSRYEALIKEGPLTGSLKLKVVNNFGDRLVIKFNLFVGSLKKGPLTHDFAERIIHGCEFDSNWLKEFENESLLVGVEILGVNEAEEPQPGPPGLTL